MRMEEVRWDQILFRDNRVGALICMRLLVLQDLAIEIDPRHKYTKRYKMMVVM